MKPNKKYPIVFSGSSIFMNNKILDSDFTSKFPGTDSINFCAKNLIANGYDFMTIDRYYKYNYKRTALLISDMASGFDSSSGLVPALSISLESPIIAYRFYHQIKQRTKHFHKIWDWPGVTSRITDCKHRFIPSAWPNISRLMKEFVPWNKRYFLTMISSNKRAFHWQGFSTNFYQPKKLMREILINIDCQYIKLVDPWMKSELYNERLNAIKYFSRYHDFHLYGNGWDTLRTTSEIKIGDQIANSWKGEVKNKLDTIAQYRFYLCYENTSFPGYLTEKIFDCLFSGVIPIYLGDPDIYNRIPKNVFIDARNFNSYFELDDYLRTITPSTANDYLEASRQFLLSDAFGPFTTEAMSKSILSAINEVYEKFI